jgi:hypothetical protein
MHRTKSFLLLVSSLTSCFLIFAPHATGQKDGRITPTPQIPCAPPCGIPPTPTPTPLKGVIMGVVTRKSIVRKNTATGGYDPIAGADEFGAIGGPGDLFGPNSAKHNIDILDESKTGWVRLWVDWPTVQPSVADVARLRGFQLTDLKDPNLFRTHVELSQIGSDTEFQTRRFIENLDEQIKLARSRGLKIILTSQRFPMWVSFPENFSEGFPEKPKKEKKRDPWGRVPTDLHRDGPWGQWIDFLIERYGDTDAKRDPANQDYQRYIDFLEIVNEPNLASSMWPQRKGDRQDGKLYMPNRVARMFKTAQLILNEHNARLNQGRTTLRLAGPATSDTMKNSSNLTSYQTFTEALLKELNRDALNFKADDNFAWSHHNYLDIEEQRNCAENEVDCFATRHCSAYEKHRPISEINSAAFIRRLLVVGVDGGSKWTGWSSTGSSRPSLLITEGGARLIQVDKIYGCRLNLPNPPKLNKPWDPAKQKEYVDKLKNKQARLVETSYHLMNEGDLSAGIALFSNHLTYTDLCYDTGLFDYLEPSIDSSNFRDLDCAKGTNYGFSGGGGGARPVYSEVWIKLP